MRANMEVLERHRQRLPVFPQKTFRPTARRPLLHDLSSCPLALPDVHEHGDMTSWGDKGALLFSLDDYQLMDDNYKTVPEYDFASIRDNSHWLYNAQSDEQQLSGGNFAGGGTTMFLMGRTHLGWSVAVRTTVYPRITLELPVRDTQGHGINWDEARLQTLERELRRAIAIGVGGDTMPRKWMTTFCDAPFPLKLRYQHVMHGFYPTGIASSDREEALRTFPFLTVYFPSQTAQRQALKLFQAPGGVIGKRKESEEQQQEKPRREYISWRCKLDVVGRQMVDVNLAERGFTNILNLLLDIGVSPGKFCALVPGAWTPVLSGFATHCDVEVTTALRPWEDATCPFVPVEYLGNQFKRIIGYDIESVPSDTKKFPNPRKEHDVLFCIGSAVSFGPNLPWRKAIHALPGSGAAHVEDKRVVQRLLQTMKNKDGSVSDPAPDLAMEYTGVEASDELDLVERWTDWVIEQDADIRTGYNISGFDEAYVADRAVLGCLMTRQGRTFAEVGALFRAEQDRTPWNPLTHETDGTRAFHCGKIISFKSQLVRSRFQSKAHGTAAYAMINTPGVVAIDLLDYVRKEFKLREYGLDYVAHHFVYSNKLSMNIQEMFARVNTRTVESCLPVLLYCVKDADLPLQIIDKIMMISKSTEMCAITNVMSRDLFARGQLWRVTSDMARFAYQLGTCLNVAPPNRTFIEKYDASMSFTGGAVMEPKKGLHLEFIGILDFRSLYPSIIIANNLCNSTLLKPDQRVPDGYTTNTWTTDVGTFTFQQDPVLGIQPQVCQTKLEQRDQAKADMKREKRAGNEGRATMQDSRQLAIKVSTNSVYGFSGASEQMNPNANLPIAATVTYIGRCLIQATMDIATAVQPIAGEPPFSTEVIYSDTDSIFVKLKGVKPCQANYTMARSIFTRISKHVTDEFERRSMRTDAVAKKAIVLEFEAIYRPLALLAKKRYICQSWESADQVVGSAKSKGIMDARRDSVPFNVKISDMCKAELMSMDDENDDASVADKLARRVQSVYGIIRTQFARLVEGQVPLDEIIITRALSAEYASTTVIQDVVARKMHARDPATRPQSGERVRILVFFDPDMHHDKTPLCERVDDPIYLAKCFATPGNRLCPDVMYVLKQFESAYTDIWDKIDPAGRGSLMTLFNGIRDTINRKRTGALSFDSIKARRQSNTTKQPIIVMQREELPREEDKKTETYMDPYAALNKRITTGSKHMADKKHTIESITKKPCRRFR